MLEKFYNDLLKGKIPHIPRSDVFYVREALRQRTGVDYSLDRVERAMYLEGFLDKKDVLDPERTREWETKS